MSAQYRWRARLGGALMAISLIAVPACQAPGQATYRMPCGGCGHTGREAMPPSSLPPQHEAPATQSDHGSHRP